MSLRKHRDVKTSNPNLFQFFININLKKTLVNMDLIVTALAYFSAQYYRSKWKVKTKHKISAYPLTLDRIKPAPF
jgi:hypothetical protein